jgi:hypothetical protein
MQTYRVLLARVCKVRSLGLAQRADSIVSVVNNSLSADRNSVDVADHGAEEPEPFGAIPRSWWPDWPLIHGLPALSICQSADGRLPSTQKCPDKLV